jgi:hypothetical protein
MTDRIVRNAVRCLKCNDVIESRDRHDYVTCGCGAVSVDGGHDYLRRAWATHTDHPQCEDLSECVPVITKGEQADATKCHTARTSQDVPTVRDIRPRIEDGVPWCDTGRSCVFLNRERRWSCLVDGADHTDCVCPHHVKLMAAALVGFWGWCSADLLMEDREMYDEIRALLGGD